jgi:hypothetical protein
MGSAYGDYFHREDIEASDPEIMAEWDAWLDAQRDPGNYETYKDRSKRPPEWKTEIYMPRHLIERLKRSNQ